jgi:amidohydrolase
MAPEFKNDCLLEFKQQSGYDCTMNPTHYVPLLACFILGVGLCVCAWAQSPSDLKEIDAVFPEARALYLDLHEHPELSSQETQTAAKLSSRLRELGYDVTEHLGGNGIVAILKNGSGPVIMLRTDLDALPVEEKTGLPYASKVHAGDEHGLDVSVMHACGHDMHMASFVGTASIMARTRDRWHGTLMLIGQPAEETITGARKMIEEGLFKRFPKPDIAVALHVSNLLPAGKIGVSPGNRFASSDSIRIKIFGKGGHGSAPQNTIDPIVIAARLVLALQTIVSREVKPGEAAVVTVGHIQGGTKNNIIPDEALLELTVRAFKPEIRKQLLAAIARITKAEAAAAGAPREPLIEQYEKTDVVYNDPALAEQLRGRLESALGKDNVFTIEASTGSEDFAYFIGEGIRSFYYILGGANPQKYAEARTKGEHLPDNHSSLFAPDFEPALRMGIASEVATLRALMK